MRPYLSKINNNEYFLKTSDLRCYHITNNNGIWQEVYLGRGDMMLPAKSQFIRQIPDFLKNIFFKLQKQ